MLRAGSKSKFLNLSLPWVYSTFPGAWKVGGKTWENVYFTFDVDKGEDEASKGILDLGFLPCTSDFFPVKANELKSVPHIRIYIQH